MSTEEVARKVVELTRKQAWREATDTLYADDIVSVEAHSMGEGLRRRTASTACGGSWTGGKTTCR
jgi:hypothetical protein